jgi:hypothetical protein
MNPCRYCVPPKRHLGCHANCPDYNDWRATLEKAKEARKRELEAEAFVRRPVPSKHNRKVREK